MEGDEKDENILSGDEQVVFLCILSWSCELWVLSYYLLLVGQLWID